MGTFDSTQPAIGSLEHQGRHYFVSCRVAFDGIEYVGRLWFADADRPNTGLPDRSAISGRSREEVLDRARKFTASELSLRHRRALAEKRRFLQLRQLTDEMLIKIRYMNQIAISMRDGLLDSDGAHQEMELTERQLYECVSQLCHVAGIEG